MPDQAALRQHVLYLLGGGGAHQDFDAVVKDLPPRLRGRQPADLPYSPWQLLEHLRRTQRDILDFSRPSAYDAKDWPDDYWPDAPTPPREDAWNEAIRQFRADLDAMKTLVRDTEDLFAQVPHADEGGQTFLREALLVADHNAYHLGQLVVVRRLLGAWPPGE